MCLLIQRLQNCAVKLDQLSKISAATERSALLMLFYMLAGLQAHLAHVQGSGHKVHEAQAGIGGSVACMQDLKGSGTPFDTIILIIIQ